MEIGLPDGDEGVLAGGHAALPHPVVAADVPRVDARVVGGLDAAQTPGTALQESVAVGAAAQLAPERTDSVRDDNLFFIYVRWDVCLRKICVYVLFEEIDTE